MKNKVCDFEKVCAILEKEVGHSFPAACLSIGVGDEVLLKKSFGLATLDTVFDIASVSKIISTTMIALRYIEDGKLRLYDRLNFFFDTPSDKSDITILHLLTHTSGLPAHYYISEFADTPELALQAILSRPLSRPIGELPVYSCIGYIVLGKILEQIGGAPLDVLAKDIVFDPLRLKNTSYRPSGDIAPTETDPATKDFLCGVVHDENARFLNGISGNAGVFSDIGDMTTFAQMLARGGLTSENDAYLSPATLREAIKNRTPGKGHELRGLGFNLAGSETNFLGDLLSRQSYGHTGFTGTSIAIDPTSGLFIVLLTNRVCPTRENIRLVRLRSLVHNAIAAEVSKHY